MRELPKCRLMALPDRWLVHMGNRWLFQMGKSHLSRGDGWAPDPLFELGEGEEGRGVVLTRVSNLPSQWLQCQANGSNVCRVLSRGGRGPALRTWRKRGGGRGRARSRPARGSIARTPAAVSNTRQQSARVSNTRQQSARVPNTRQHVSDTRQHVSTCRRHTRQLSGRAAPGSIARTHEGNSLILIRWPNQFLGTSMQFQLILMRWS